MKNKQLERRISEFLVSEDDDDFEIIFEELTERALSGGELLAALDIMDPEIKKKADKAGSFSNLDIEGDELEMSFSVLESEDGDSWVVAFTGEDQLSELEDDEDFYCLPIADLFLNVMNVEDVEGIVINPWSEPLPVPKDLIETFLSGLQEAGEEGNVMLVLGDITELEVDAIVNAANNTLLGGGGVDGAIHRAAGPALLDECRQLHGCKTGEAKITYGYDLPAEYVIHTVGPIYSGTYRDQKLLEDCYWNSLTLAREHGIHTIAFPSISTGAYGYPVKKAVEVAVPAVMNWFDANEDYDMKVTFCCYDQATYFAYEEYLDEMLGE